MADKAEADMTQPRPMSAPRLLPIRIRRMAALLSALFPQRRGVGRLLVRDWT
jgi:hypothetical protein